MFDRATAEEIDFLRRLLVGELRQGALAGLMADAVAKAASVPVALVRRAAMMSGDLGRVAVVALTDGRGRTARSRARGRAGACSRCSPAGAPDVAAALGDVGLASVEWKLDGARIQVHRHDDDVHIYTRNLNEITGRLAWRRRVGPRAAGPRGRARR